MTEEKYILNILKNFSINEINELFRPVDQALTAKMYDERKKYYIAKSNTSYCSCPSVKHFFETTSKSKSGASKKLNIILTDAICDLIYTFDLFNLIPKLAYNKLSSNDNTKLLLYLIVERILKETPNNYDNFIHFISNIDCIKKGIVNRTKIYILAKFFSKTFFTITIQ